MKKKDTAKRDGLIGMVAFLVFLLVVFIATEILGSSQVSIYIKGNLPETPDSMNWIIYRDGTLRDSSDIVADTAGYDTTIVCTTGHNYMIYEQVFWAGTADEERGNIPFSLNLLNVSGASSSPNNVVTITSIDSSGTDNAVQGVNVTVKNTTTDAQLTQSSNASGQTVWALIDGTYEVNGYKTSYIFQPPDTIVLTTDTSYGDSGYNVPVDPLIVGDSVCTVTVNVKNNAGNAQENVEVTAYLAKSNVVDWDGNAVYNITQTKRTNSSGQATFACLYSSAMQPATKWVFTSMRTLRRTITIPSQASYTVDLSP